MAITPIDIQQHQFKSQLLGYDKAAVDRFLELVADDLERLHLQQQQTREELARAQEELAQMRERESTLKQTLITAQKVTDELRDNARKEVEVIIADAQIRAEQIVREAENRRIGLINEVQELKRQKVSFESGVRALVESHLRLLDLDLLPLSRSEAAQDALQSASSLEELVEGEEHTRSNPKKEDEESDEFGTD
ncbi:DivIVA domain-containing protein [Geoalkalibacter subterraneus]|uniref:Cell division protein DivIVA n=1 Tax=Geoalkalibacter subterraneus TaxID=483547 RepID=A0A0B5FID7_9BACT|nr:DivIVA domain-containing protein [Geoalkalibacter subterraneus]AJF07098.1 cell division protein DivIVA [Geoalkalibacter subterraneus]